MNSFTFSPRQVRTGPGAVAFCCVSGLSSPLNAAQAVATAGESDAAKSDLLREQGKGVTWESRVEPIQRPRN